MKDKLLAVSGLALILGVGKVMATPFTETSPTGFDVTTVGATSVGGIVTELIGANNVRVISQVPASSLFVGFAGTNPQNIGTQTGFGPGITGALGGGISQVSFRFTLFDGDTGPGDFDFNDVTLLVNNLNFGNWSSVNAQHTDGSGNAGSFGFSGGGFRNNLLDTGWFTSTDPTLLTNLFNSILTTQKLVFALNDIDPRDNFYDFTQGVGSSLINIGQGPTIKGQVPAPATLALFGLGLAGLCLGRSRVSV